MLYGRDFKGQVWHDCTEVTVLNPQFITLVFILVSVNKIYLTLNLFESYCEGISAAFYHWVWTYVYQAYTIVLMNLYKEWYGQVYGIEGNSSDIVIVTLHLRIVWVWRCLATYIVTLQSLPQSTCHNDGMKTDDMNCFVLLLEKGAL